MLKTIHPYKYVNRLIEAETYEPMLAWGLRMAIIITIPLIAGILTGNMGAATWIIITAESICWVELKGSFGQRSRVLLGGAFLAVFFGLVGSVSSNSIWWSGGLSLPVMFIACLFKNLGERGSGLSLCVYVMFIMSNAYPVSDPDEILQRCLFIFAGGIWATFVGLLASVFMSEQTPYKRTIAFIWKSVASLAQEIDKGWNGKDVRAGIRDIYLKEKDLRTAIDHSIELYSTLAHQAKTDNRSAYLLAQLRKTAALTGTNLIALANELEAINLKTLDNQLRLSIHAILNSIDVISERMTIYTVTARPEEEVLLRSRIMRLQNMCALIREHRMPASELEKRSISRIVQLTERIIRLIENSIGHIVSVGSGQKVYRSYSLLKTILILHPKYWFQSLRLLTNFNTFFFRYALRTTIAASAGVLLYKYFNIHYGYWLPFTVMIVIQPYFGATVKKATDRILGTLLGGVAGGLLLLLPPHLYVKEILLGVTPILMVYFLRKQYSIATFFITIFLVILFAVEEEFSYEVVIIRALCTIGGAATAIAAEFALLPTWDKNWLPRHIADSFKSNLEYFLFTFYTQPNNANTWTHYKRIAESSNSNAFDSFNRYMQEPVAGQKNSTLFYQIIMHQIRLTRELNNIHIEREYNSDQQKTVDATEQIREARDILLRLLQQMESKGVNSEKQLSGTAYQSALPSASLFTVQQLDHIEKITLELKAMDRDLQKW